MRARGKCISAILLGAGQSTRMGRNKLALPWGRKTVFGRCLETLLHSELKEVNVIFSEKNRAVTDGVKDYPTTLRAKIRLVRNPCPWRGMSGSIRRGVKSLRPDSQGVLIALGDQPLLRRRTINALIRAFTPGDGKIVAPFYGRRRGNPVLFDRSYIGKLSKLRGDAGGRSIIDSHPDKVIRVRTRSAAVLKDIDTWEEYSRQKASKTRNQRSELRGQKAKTRAHNRQQQREGRGC